MITPKRMEVYYAKLEKANGSVQYGHRPVLVVSNNVSNHASGVLMVAPLTTKRKKNLPTHVMVDLKGWKDPRCTILCEQIRTISQKQLGSKIMRFKDPEVIGKINRALTIAIGLDDRYNPMCPNWPSTQKK